MSWFKNLKKWQRGGLIGCATGLLFAVIILLSPQGISRPDWWELGQWLFNFHMVLFFPAILLTFMMNIFESQAGYNFILYGGSATIVVLYGGFGATVGRVQQLSNPVWKWLLTALLALLLLGFYVMHYVFYHATF
jgi:hypothetical protein